MAKFNEYMKEEQQGITRWRLFSDFILGAVSGAVLATALLLIALL